MIIKKATIFFFGFMLLTACNDNRIFDEVQKLTDNEWKTDDPHQFLVSINDTLSVYDILIHIRNDNNYEYKNMWLFIETNLPNGANMRDTVEIILADDAGQWLGKGLGPINTMLVPYKSNIRFPYRGIYSFSMQQAMRKNVIHGIKDIGLQVQKH